MKFINIASYRFVSLAEQQLPELQKQLRDKTHQHELKGTILLSPEGINLFLAGSKNNIDAFRAYLESFAEFKNLIYKESYSDVQPFGRMRVRIKKEIIAFGRNEIQPEKKTAAAISPQELKRWCEEKKDLVLLDVRNTYEVAEGTFDNAIDLHIKTFRTFPEAVTKLPAEMKEKPIITFCTGGIRCEKAAEYMLQIGFKKVYQLAGGILNYFEQCGGDFYHGECFVFDERGALNNQLEKIERENELD